jgi:hypothetical protein
VTAVPPPIGVFVHDHEVATGVAVTEKNFKRSQDYKLRIFFL